MDNETAQLKRLTAPLLRWYDGNRRRLPWREEVSPYRTWVSEIMLQQTRVAAVLPYFARFMAELPDVEALAAVPEERLLKLWEGLGYYSRARNLQKAARAVVEDYGGRFPHTYEEVIRLAGIGDYTAGAILSIAFGQKIPAVDGNVLRIAARVTGSERNISDAASKKAIRGWIEESMSGERPGAYNQALMDLGATVCLPAAEPLCDQCPAGAFCAAHLQRRTRELPVRSAKKKRRVEEKTVFVFLRDGEIAVRKRESEGLLAGLFEFPNLPGTLEEAVAAEQLARWGLVARQWEKKLTAKHIFTHVEWHMTGYVLAVRGTGAEDWRWCGGEEFHTLAIPSAFEKLTAEARRLFEMREKGETEDGTALL